MKRLSLIAIALLVLAISAFSQAKAEDYIEVTDSDWSYSGTSGTTARDSRGNILDAMENNLQNNRKSGLSSLSGSERIYINFRNISNKDIKKIKYTFEVTRFRGDEKLAKYNFTDKVNLPKNEDFEIKKRIAVGVNEKKKYIKGDIPIVTIKEIHFTDGTKLKF